MKYYMKPISASLYALQRSRTRIGQVCKNSDGKWVATAEKQSVAADTPRTAFHGLVQKLNRISLCGEDNAKKAATAVHERNEEVRREVEEINRAAGLRIARTRSRRVNI